jgi:hypothetical protein
MQIRSQTISSCLNLLQPWLGHWLDKTHSPHVAKLIRPTHVQVLPPLHGSEDRYGAADVLEKRIVYSTFHDRSPSTLQDQESLKSGWQVIRNYSYV